MASQESQKKLFSNGFAVVIGTGTNIYGKPALKYHSTVNDAEWIYEILIDESRCAYPKDQVKLLVGEKAKREDILSAFGWLKENTTDDSTILIFFSGHGRRVEGENDTHIVPYGASRDSSKDTITAQQLFKLLNDLKAQKVILLPNCCWAGGVMPKLPSLGVGDNDEMLGLGNVPLSEKHINMLRDGKGFTVLSSSRRNEMSFTGFYNRNRGKRYSAFAVGICLGLLGIGLPATDDVVRISDLASSCQEFVRKKTKNRQNPYFNFERADNFAVAGLSGQPDLGDGEDLSDFKVSDDGDGEDNDDRPLKIVQSQVFSNMGIFAHGNAIAFGGINNLAKTGNANITFHLGPSSTT